MLKAIVAALALAGLAVGAMPEPSQAASEIRAKSRQAAEKRQRTAAPSRDVSSQRDSSQVAPRLRDRSTYYSKDGRIDGKEFFDQVNERAPAGGQ